MQLFYTIDEVLMCTLVYPESLLLVAALPELLLVLGASAIHEVSCNAGDEALSLAGPESSIFMNSVIDNIYSSIS